MKLRSIVWKGILSLLVIIAVDIFFEIAQADEVITATVTTRSGDVIDLEDVKIMFIKIIGSTSFP